MSSAVSFHLEFTDARFVFAGKSYPDIALLVDSKHSFVEPVSEYLRHLVIFDHLRTSSTETYAEYIRHFWQYLDDNRLDFHEICDRDLLQWLNQQEANDVSDWTRAARCDAVFSFYVWLELNSYVHHLIRIPGWNDTDKFLPRLTSVAAKGMHMRRRNSKLGIISAVRPRVAKGGKQPTPSADEVSRIHIAAENPENLNLTERNHLLIEWYVQVGVRRMEWSSLTKDQIPDGDAVISLRQLRQAHELRLTKTKGGGIRHVR